MELFLFRRHEWERLYNCSGIDIDSVPMERRRAFDEEAWVTIVLCAIYYVLYIPCICSIWKHHKNNACYTILLYIGIMDLSALWILGFWHGWLSLHGAVFCSHPVLIYWTGMASTSIFMAESTADLILAFNRCLEFLIPRLVDKFFSGWRVHIWLLFCSSYALYWFVLVKPGVFSSIHFAWFFYPFVGYREDTLNEFAIPLHSIHNTTMAIATPLIYFLFAILVKVQSWHTSNSNVSHMQKMVFLQVFIISLINTVAEILYATMQHTVPRQWMITLGEFAWFHIHGFPPVIYLTLNRTIRKDCLIMWNGLWRRENQISTQVEILAR